MDLATLADLSANSLSAYENGKTTPRDESVQRMADVLRYPFDFFYTDEAPIVDPGIVSFRGLARMPAAQRDRVVGAAGLAIELDSWIEQRFNRPMPELPDLSALGPVTAAEATRSEWGLGHGPIGNLIHVIERAGVRVYSLPAGDADELDAIDALSMWWGGVPFVFLNTRATVERARHTLAHEVGHLILHRDGGPTGQHAEKEANRFAGNLLLPASALRAEAKRYFTFEEIVAAKQRWRVSALAYVYRMNEEGLLDPWRYKELCIRLRRDYGAGEPSPALDPETSQVLRKVFEDIRPDGRGRIASDLAMPIEYLDSLVFAHTLTPISGSNGRGDRPGPSPPNLRVV